MIVTLKIRFSLSIKCLFAAGAHRYFSEAKLRGFFEFDQHQCVHIRWKLFHFMFSSWYIFFSIHFFFSSIDEKLHGWYIDGKSVSNNIKLLLCVCFFLSSLFLFIFIFKGSFAYWLHLNWTASILIRMENTMLLFDISKIFMMKKRTTRFGAV